MKTLFIQSELNATLNKKDIEDRAQRDAASLLQHSDLSALEMYIELKRYHHYLTSILEIIKDPALQVAQQTEVKNFTHASAKVSIITRTKYDYRSDVTWRSLDSKASDIKDQLKAHQEKLSALEAPTNYIDPDTGEVIELIPPEKSVEQSLMVRL